MKSKNSMTVHPKIKKFILEKLTEDLKSKNILDWKNEIWVLDLDTKEWYLTILSEGETWYNQDFFKVYLNLFSVTNRELSCIIKEWIENNFELRLTNVSRRQNNMTYIIDGMLKTDKNNLNLNNRFGFSYNFVKKFINIKSGRKNIILEDFIPY